MRGERGPELRVGRDRRMADAVDRLDRVPEPDRVDAAPATGGADAGADLEVEVAMRVAGAGGVVPDNGRLDLLDRHLHLASAWPDTGGRL